MSTATASSSSSRAFSLPPSARRQRRSSPALTRAGAANTWGTAFRVTTFGESHGKGVGCVIDGVPPRLRISKEEIQFELDRRRPGQSRITTPRKESDTCEIYSGENRVGGKMRRSARIATVKLTRVFFSFASSPSSVFHPRPHPKNKKNSKTKKNKKASPPTASPWALPSASWCPTPTSAAGTTRRCRRRTGPRTRTRPTT